MRLVTALRWALAPQRLNVEVPSQECNAWRISCEYTLALSRATARKAAQPSILWRYPLKMTGTRIAAFLSGSKPKMNHLDKKITEVQNQLAVLQRQREAARLERAKSYADAFIRKLEVDDIPLAVGLKAFQDLSKVSGTRSTSRS